MRHRTVVLACLLLVAASITACSAVEADKIFNVPTDKFMALEANDLEGTVFKFESLKTERIHCFFIINVASASKYTDLNYKQLVQLHKAYAEKGLRILAFPCNQFGEQEPGSAKEIRDFVTKKGVPSDSTEFMMFDKVEVNGKNAHRIFRVLQPPERPLLTKDNFSTKMLIHCLPDACIVERYDQTFTDPNDIESTIRLMLNLPPDHTEL